MDAPPTNGSGNLGDLWQGRGQPLCLKIQLSLSNLFLEEQGCAGPGMVGNHLLYAFPLITPIPQVIRRVREHRHRVLFVAALWINHHWISELSQLLIAAPLAGSPLSGEQYDFAPSAGTVGSTCVGSRRESVDLHENFLNTISQARALSTRRLYALKWSVFSAWCTTRGKDLYHVTYW